jgi:hypothetical protein
MAPDDFFNGLLRGGSREVIACAADAVAGSPRRVGPAVEPPDAIEESKRRARYHLTLDVDHLELVERSRTGGLDRCRASGIVERVHRRPRLRFGRGPRGPREAERFAVEVLGWDARDPNEPPGPGRLHYGDGRLPGRIDVWGSFAGGEFVTFEFHATP